MYKTAIVHVLAFNAHVDTWSSLSSYSYSHSLWSSTIHQNHFMSFAFGTSKYKPVTNFDGLLPRFMHLDVYLTTEKSSCYSVLEVVDRMVRHISACDSTFPVRCHLSHTWLHMHCPSQLVPLNAIRCLATAHCHVNSFCKTAVINFPAAVQRCRLGQCCLDDIAFVSLHIVMTLSCLASCGILLAFNK